MEQTQPTGTEQSQPTYQPDQEVKIMPLKPNVTYETESIHGMQMLNITKDHKYILNKTGLEGLLLRDDVKDLPVMVVTVAGAYRMGKSFLLDYFLRYLQAPREKQINGEWLGEPDAPLTGFSWRGGSERHTTGMVTWPEPIFAYLPSGEKVLVMLYDTQGTFDSESTVRDNSTVFALSTLLSSVLIYNLKDNIKEDDLQHLQLFTKYGELARTKDEKAFQILEFLVRDYPFPSEHPYGQQGGEELLNLRLQISKDMPEEKRSLREHIRSAYETVTAFLMPHPGFQVTKKGYNGNHGELENSFKEYLKQLTDSLFSPEKITLKKIGGEPIKAKELVAYIKTYVQIFDSDVLPKPMDIVKATIQAGLLLAARESREMYEAHMENECGPNEPSMPIQEINALHNRALLEAIEAFKRKKKMGSEADMEPYLAKLNQDIEKKLNSYLILNQGKVQKAIADSKAAYEKKIRSATQGKPLCLNHLDLKKLHREAASEASQLFNSRRRQNIYGRDEEKTNFLKEIADRLDELEIENERNNKLFLSESLIKYNNFMNSLLSSDPPLDEEAFESKHLEQKSKALASFYSHRNFESSQIDDSFSSLLFEKIHMQYLNIKVLNRSKYRKAMHTAIVFYNTSMESFWDPNEYCLHPSDLRKEHKRVKALAMKMFKSDSDEADDLESVTVSQNMELRYRELQELNATSNHSAIAAAYRKYKDLMDKNCSPTAWWLLIVPMIVHFAKKWEYHTEARSAALAVFYSKRKDLMSSEPDPYLDTLKEKLDDAYRMY